MTPQAKFLHYIPLFKDHFDSSDIKRIAKNPHLDIAEGTLRNYLRGAVPCASVCTIFVSEGIKALKRKGIKVQII